MPASPLDSAIYHRLMGDAEVARLFSDTAELRAMLIVWGALAKAQAGEGIIPPQAAETIQRAALEVQIDPAVLADGAATSAVPVPALVAAFRAEIGDPSHAAYLHWGATSQDIMDTALALRLRQVLALFEARLGTLLGQLADLADAHADLPMAGRTYGQVATPTSFGAAIAAWGRPLLALRAELPALKAAVTCVSLSGAAGTAEALGPRAPALRQALAAALNLHDPGASWHAERHQITALSAWMTRACAQLGKIGEDLVTLTRSEIAEVMLATAGASSTMPQKQNPVLPSLLGALARQAVGLNSVLQTAALHRDQRDGTAWMSEWLSLPQLAQITGRGLVAAMQVTTGLTPNPAAMARNLDPGTGLIFAEALSFALAATHTRPEAQAITKRLCADVQATGMPLPDLARTAYPDLPADLFRAAAALGQAPAEARAFAKSARSPD